MAETTLPHWITKWPIGVVLALVATASVAEPTGEANRHGVSVGGRERTFIE